MEKSTAIKIKRMFEEWRGVKVNSPEMAEEIKMTILAFIEGYIDRILEKK